MARLCVVFAAILLAAAAVSGHLVSPKKSISTSSYGQTYAPGDLIFEDTFDTFDQSTWHHEANMNGGGNNEFQIYDRYDNNTYVKDGALHIHPTWTLDVLNQNYETLYNGYHYVECCTDPPRGGACDRQAGYPNILQPAHSGRVRTKSSFSFRYGKIEVRAKIPTGDWMWPAIWLLPEKAVYGGWPASGEIDIMESRGNKNLRDMDGVHIGSERIGSTLHYGPFWPHNGYWAATGAANSAPDQGYGLDFHNYQLEWTDSYMKFSIDDIEVHTVTPPAGGFFELGAFDPTIENPWVNGTNPRMAPFDEEFHIILNVAVGGNFFPAESVPPRPWATAQTFLDFWEAREEWNPTWLGDDGALQIDHVRVWAV